jgi:RNA polymerase sigma-70 factor (ECF subfamily)
MDELIGGLKAGRPEAFERLVREFGDRIYRFVKRLAGERSAEDLTQEVFIRVHRSIDAYRPEGRFESWLFAIAGNLCIDHSRRRKPEASLSELDQDLAPERFRAAGQGPIEAAEEEERRQALVRAVERLPFEQKQVFLLREEAGLSFREIAETMGCPLNTALGRMHYAMEALRKSLKAYGMQ